MWSVKMTYSLLQRLTYRCDIFQITQQPGVLMHLRVNLQCF